MTFLVDTFHWVRVVEAMVATNSTKAKTGLPRFQLKQFMMAITAICIVVAFLTRPLLQTINNTSRSKWLRASPFTDVWVENERVTVEFNNKSYELISINGATTQQLLAAADRSFGYAFGAKRFVEDLPALLDTMGKLDNQQTVELVLQDSSGKQTTIPDAPMSAHNRAEVYRNSIKRKPGFPTDGGFMWPLLGVGAVVFLCLMATDVRRFQRVA